MKQPYNEKGHKVTRSCPNPDCSGTLQNMGNGSWECDGLVDPNDPNQELEACAFSHQDGEPYNSSPEQYSVWAAAKGKFGYGTMTGQRVAAQQRVTK